MRHLYVGVIALAILLIPPGAGAEQALTFEASLATVESQSRSIVYSDLEPIAANSKCRISGLNAFIELFEDESLDQIGYTTKLVDEIATVDWFSDSRDIHTGDNDMFENDPVSYQEALEPGRSPVLVLEEVHRDGRRWAALQLFPVTVDFNGIVRVHGKIEITVGERKISPDDLLTSIPDPTLAKTDRADLSQNGDAVDYVIVTSAELFESLQPLASYKNSTGYSTALIDIAEIVAVYPGVDNAESLREYLKDFHAQGGTYVLLAGDETVLPVRYAYPYAVSYQPALDQLQLCDLYFADLEGDWDVDGDGVYGERNVDQADISPELLVGRLPFNEASEFEAYTEKLIAYETGPGGGESEYLERAFFFSSDQMRDYSSDGQHERIASVYPANFEIDTLHGVELSRGSDAAPTNMDAHELDPILEEGHGIVNIISHGMATRFEVRTAEYNEWPKSHFTTDQNVPSQGQLDQLTAENKPGFYYSLACNNGGFDIDGAGDGNLATRLLAYPDAGAVGFVAYSRWGWVGSSYLLQMAYFDSLFAHPEEPAPVAMYESKERYYYYRDIVYGMNYLGDPTLRVYSEQPDSLIITEIPRIDRIDVVVSTSTHLVSNARVVISDSLGIVAQGTTDNSGFVSFDLEFSPGAEYTVAAVKPGCTVARIVHAPSIVADVDDDPFGLPHRFALHQNYPNPFNPSTTIEFDLARRSDVRLEVFNVLGRRVNTLIDGNLPAGNHRSEFAGDNTLASGVYFYRLEAGDEVATRKMVLLR